MLCNSPNVLNIVACNYVIILQYINMLCCTDFSETSTRVLRSSAVMASKYREILTSNFADLKHQLPIEDILCSERLLEHFGPEEIRIIECCTTMQEKSNEFLLKLLRKPQAAFDVFMLATATGV